MLGIITLIASSSFSLILSLPSSNRAELIQRLQKELKFDKNDELFDLVKADRVEEENNINKLHNLHYNDDGLLDLVQADRVIDDGDLIPGMELTSKFAIFNLDKLNKHF